MAQTIKNLPAMKETRVWREWLPTPVFLSGEFHGQGSLASYSSWGSKESNTTEWLTLWHIKYRGLEKLAKWLLLKPCKQLMAAPDWTQFPVISGLVVLNTIPKASQGVIRVPGLSWVNLQSNSRLCPWARWISGACDTVTGTGTPSGAREWAVV